MQHVGTQQRSSGECLHRLGGGRGCRARPCGASGSLCVWVRVCACGGRTLVSLVGLLLGCDGLRLMWGWGQCW